MTIVIAMSSMAVAQTPPAATPTAKPAVQITTEQFRASDILGTNVKNVAGDTVGEVKDLVILRNEEVLQAILSVGGFLGAAEKLVAVPYDALNITYIDDKQQARYNATEEELKTLPSFTYN